MANFSNYIWAIFFKQLEHTYSFDVIFISCSIQYNQSILSMYEGDYEYNFGLMPRDTVCTRNYILTRTSAAVSDIETGSSSHDFMMTSSNGNILRVTGPLCGEFTGHR